MSLEYGERWPTLRKSLEKETVKACLINKYCEEIEGLEVLDLISIELNGLVCLIHRESGNEDNQDNESKSFMFPKPNRDINSLCHYYLLDIASILPTVALKVEPHHTVLDMCAAPGGKSFALAQQLDFESTTHQRLHLNEVSNERRLRLMKTLKYYIPVSFHKNIKVTGYDTTQKSCFPFEHFDRILIDAPCSTDRHVIQNAILSKSKTTSSSKHEVVTKWSPSRLKTDAARQLSLVISGFNALKPNGLMVYATCSLSQVENDQVVSKAIKKLNGKLKVLPQQFSIGEATDLGWIVLPDRCQNWGPLYFSLLQKVDS